jgi:1,4-alpha-glucan branching enzyme
MWTQPGKKLLFMGGEFAQRSEWDHDASLDWHLLDYEPHAGIQRLVGELNRLYRAEPALHATDFEPAGFEWIDANDSEHSALVYLRSAVDSSADVESSASVERSDVLVALNFTPVVRRGYRVGAPRAGRWAEVFNSDAEVYGGSGVGNLGAVEARAEPHHGQPCSLELTLPPLGAVVLRG